MLAAIATNIADTSLRHDETPSRIAMIGVYFCCPAMLTVAIFAAISSYEILWRPYVFNITAKVGFHCVLSRLCVCFSLALR